MNLEKKKKELELSKVKCAKQEMELKILERLEDIQRIEDNIKIQDNKIMELESQLQGE